ncbi:hypothetical protein [Lentibacillus cibarius]|uniref:Uncharacterized protein n=1 Tax=Lentibacillus cibarius TaxID=2583219 RepID=A0A5S3QIF9_9BACI|nr:hypothetical protein [Lentibacillus cibarius]TMN21710.1 hypothetical protein FFL34_05970 [Lentibacillus cibarius]
MAMIDIEGRGADKMFDRCQDMLDENEQRLQIEDRKLDWRQVKRRIPLLLKQFLQNFNIFVWTLEERKGILYI